MLTKKAREVQSKYTDVIEAGGSVLLALVLCIGSIAIAVGMVLAIYWLFWQVWIFVIPQIFTAAPAVVTNPSFWTFAGSVLLINWVRRMLFGPKVVRKDG